MQIKIKSNAPATHYTSTGLGFSDGTEVPADVIVWSTGFELGSRDSVRRLFGEAVVSQIEDSLGLNEEGESKGAYKIQRESTVFLSDKACADIFADPGLITHGGALGQARYLSRYIALQIRATLEGKPFRPYLDTPVPVQSHYNRLQA